MSQNISPYHIDSLPSPKYAKLSTAKSELLHTYIWEKFRSLPGIYCYSRQAIIRVLVTNEPECTETVKSRNPCIRIFFAFKHTDEILLYTLMVISLINKAFFFSRALVIILVNILDSLHSFFFNLYLKTCFIESRKLKIKFKLHTLWGSQTHPFLGNNLDALSYMVPLMTTDCNSYYVIFYHWYLYPS